jgi:hypothetical protein
MQDDWTLVHLANGLEFLSLTSSSMEKLVCRWTDTNFRSVFFCHFARYCPTWKALIRKVLREMLVLRDSRILGPFIFRWGFCDSQLAELIRAAKQSNPVAMKISRNLEKTAGQENYHINNWIIDNLIESDFALSAFA